MPEGGLMLSRLFQLRLVSVCVMRRARRLRVGAGRRLSASLTLAVKDRRLPIHDGGLTASRSNEFRLLSISRCEIRPNYNRV